MRRRRNAGRAEHLLTVRIGRIDVPVYVWRGGIPSIDELAEAPDFTFFPSPRKVEHMADSEYAERPAGETVWSVSEIGPHVEQNVESALPVGRESSGSTSQKAQRCLAASRGHAGRATQG